jgi:NAD(P)H-nitrite reductase large subunit
MNGNHVKYLLVGGGLAGSAAAEAIRARDPHSSLMLVGQEVNRPYHRPPLSKEYLRREKSHAELSTLPAGWFEEHEVELRTGRRVAQLDTSRRLVSLDNGEDVAFDMLLLATGGTPAPLKIPGADLPNIFYIRTIEDIDRLHHAIDQAKAGGQPHERGRGVIGVIGGGVLGVELAASLTQMGLRAELFHGHAQPWDKFAGENVGKFVARYVESEGVALHLGQRPQALEGDGRVQRVALASGESIRCDFVIAAVGMNVNRELLRGTPIAAEKAILCDDHCRTNVDGIFAAGDCAAVFDPLFGKHRILDHWDNAQVTGKIAGANMAGDTSVRYDGVNYFFSDVFNLSLSAWGEPKLASHRLLRGTPTLESPDVVEFGIAPDGRITQVVALNHPNEDDMLRELVKQRVNVTGREEKLKDPAFNLRQLLS